MGKIIKGGNYKTVKMKQHILVCGDFCPRSRVSSIIDNNMGKSLLKDWCFLLSKMDYSIINLECPVVKDSKLNPIRKIGPCLRTNEPSIDLLKNTGFDMVTLANNHFFDYGQEGVEDTLSLLDKYGIEYVGGGRNKEMAEAILYKEIDNKHFAFVNFCENEFSIANSEHGGANPISLVDNYYQIQEANKIADYVIVIVHGGHEGFQLPNPTMVKNYRFFVDAGANVVINHHQHCFSGYEIYKDAPIFYGLGNFCFDRNNMRHNIWNEGYAVELCFNNEDLSFKLHPYIQCAEEPSVLILKDQAGFMKKLALLNEIIANEDKLNLAFDKYAKKELANIRSTFQPYQNRYLRKLFKLKFLLDCWNMKHYRNMMNKFTCEAHRELFIRGLELLTNKR